MDIKKFPVYFVRKSDPAAMRVVMKLCEDLRPGQIIPVDSSEWIALHKSVIRLDVDLGDDR